MDSLPPTQDNAQQSVTTLLHLPTEVILLILSVLGPGEILNVRKTCKALCAITQDRALWIDLYSGMTNEARYALPDRDAADLFAPLTRAEVESFILSAYLTERRWTLPRKPPQLLESPGAVQSVEESMHAGTSILTMSVLADRWLVVLYPGDVVEIWDICPSSGHDSSGIAKAWNGPHTEGAPTAACRTRYDVQGLGPCSMSAVVLDEDGRSIIMAVGSQVKTQVLKFNLAGGPDMPDYERLSAFETPSPLYTLRAVDPSTQIVLYSHALSVCFVNWRTQKYCLVTSETDGEELWSGIIGVSLLTSHHVLCVTTRSIEVYTLDFIEDLQRPISPTAQHNPLYLYNIGRRPAVAHKHAIPDATLRGVSFSQAQLRADGDVHRVSAGVLAYDVLRGLFHFSVALTLPASHAPQPYAHTPLDVACTLRGAHHMAQLVPLADVVPGTAPPRGGFTPGSRGFISACALGARGVRGVWIERRRNNMGRTVFGFAVANHRVARGSQDGAEEPVAEIDGRCVYEGQNSVDLRDDLTHCAFSELTGQIVLGTRRGQVLLL
ncbi:F-box protein [Phanerochaete sordida]|uniref:F-box protein n=1 Tax=Phanerochaete sordida TaxID=48140 RepID=A0A9P3LLD6_9APHY|nr:F-box protein [Phanerochaete sordida]